MIRAAGLLLCAYSIASASSADVEPITQLAVVEIGSVVKGKVTLPAAGLVVGETGMIQRELSGYKVIIASLTVESVGNDVATAKVGPFTGLHQPYLPSVNLSVQGGDKAIFRSMNNRAFLIAPNVNSYDSIRKNFKFIEFLSSDLLLAYLNIRGKYDPTPSLLKGICKKYSAGLVFISGSEEIGIFDCQSFAKLRSMRLDSIDPALTTFKETVSPFYARVDFKSGGSLTYLFSSKKSKEDYFGYYDSIINTTRK